jgi:hypothetical protein
MNRATLPWMSVLLLSLAPAFVQAEPLLDEPALSARIDQLLSAQWAAKGVKPAARADDAEFFRRLSLDLNGRIPSITLLKDFLDDTRPNKRQIWANKLMDGRDPDFKRIDKRLPDLYANHFTNFWRTVIFAQISNRELANLAFNLDPWLRGALKENLPYDRMVVEFLTGQGQPFFRANDNKPEYIAGSAARLFLGVKLECAQCHEDRSGPDGKGYWTRDQFWQYAAFFKPGQLPPKIDIPGARRVIEAQFLDGRKPAWKNGDNPRVVLAQWMTSPNNPYFARAAVNRMWHYFFGIGLTDPVDFMGTADNPPSHPELLDEVARQFAAHNFDIRYLIRAITGTEAYQRTSARSDASQDDLRLFARMGPRGQSAEQLFDSVLQATGQWSRMPAFKEPFYERTNPTTEFLDKFANGSDKRTGTQTSTLQALYLMNSPFVAKAMECEGGTLESIAGARVSMARRIQELYLTTLSRKPRADEMQRLSKYLDNDLSADDTRKALADIFWALLNSPEFLLNH